MIFDNFLVDFPTPNTNTPSANGSKVPECPTFSLVIFFTFLTIEKEDKSFGLYML